MADRRATGFEPIRITFDFSHVESNGEGSEQQQYIKDIINRSKEWLERALKVPRLSGNLVLPADFLCGDVPSVPAKYTDPGAANTDTLIFVLSESSSDPDHPCASGLTTQPRMTSARATRAQREREREKEREREREREERERRERERERARERDTERQRASDRGRASERASERAREKIHTHTHARTHTHIHTHIQQEHAGLRLVLRPGYNHGPAIGGVHPNVSSTPPASSTERRVPSLCSVTRRGRPSGVRRPPKAELSLFCLLTYIPL